MGGREFGIQNDYAVAVDTGEFGFGADTKYLLDFKCCFSLGGPKAIFGRDKLREDDSLADVFGGNII